MGIKHNCCKECEFEFISIATVEGQKDVIECKICGREWEEKLNEKK